MENHPVATILCLVPVTSLTKWGNVTELNSTSVRPRPRRRHHVQDRFTVVRGAMIAVNDRSDNGVRRCRAPPVLRRAGGGAGMGESWIEPTRADLRADVLERLPRLVVK